MTPPAEAVRVAFWAVVTEDTEAVKVALLEPEGTVIDAGTATALSLLARATIRPPLPAPADRLTVQVSLPAPVKDLVAQARVLSTPAATWPVPLRVTVAVPGEALSLKVMVPFAVPVVVGVKVTASATVWPGFSVVGKLRPDTLNPVPDTAMELTVRGAEPDEVRVTVCAVDVVLMVMLPKLMLPELSVTPGTYAPRPMV